MNARKIRRYYKHKQSEFSTWEQKEHAEEYLIYPDNLGTHIGIDEVSLSKGELYTFVTNKPKNGGNRNLIACIRGTKSNDIIQVLEKLPKQSRDKVKEVSLDMAPNMESASRTSFKNAKLVTDRFHVVRLVQQALQHLRVKLRWEAIDIENKAIEKAKEEHKKYVPKRYSNGDTPKQLLARSRYIIIKKENDWTENQKKRAELLFEKYPILERGYKLTLEFRNIYEEKIKSKAESRMKEWLIKSKDFPENVFITTNHTINNRLDTIMNFFDNRSTNARAESFNAKIKLFRANQRRVRDTQFFLFRLEKLFA